MAEITGKIANGKLILEIPLLEEEKETPKMHMVASSGGFTDIPLKHKGKDLRVNVMVGYRK